MTGVSTRMDGEIAAIDVFSRDQLAGRWTKINGQRPPAIRRELLSLAVAWDVQTTRLGGYSPETRRRLKQAIATLGNNLAGPRAPENESNAVSPRTGMVVSFIRHGRAALPSVGARLVRVWNGHTNVVDVVEGGYLFEGKVHRSLSAIARKITKAHWSGPRFFGL